MHSVAAYRGWPQRRRRLRAKRGSYGSRIPRHFRLLRFLVAKRSAWLMVGLRVVVGISAVRGGDKELGATQRRCPSMDRMAGGSTSSVETPARRLEWSTGPCRSD